MSTATISPTSVESNAETEEYDVAIVGAGYVGLPLATVFAEAGKRVLLLDSSKDRVKAIRRAESYIEDVPSDQLRSLVGDTLFASTNYDRLRSADAIVIALPTPLSAQRERDLTIVMSATREIAARLRPGQLVVLDSTTYPGTTREVLLPILETSGLEVGIDFNLAFSPERVDPGRTDWTTKTVPKI